MKCRVTVDFDTDTGDYEIETKNLAEPGVGIDYHVMIGAMRKIFGDFSKQMGDRINQAVDKARNDN